MQIISKEVGPNGAVLTGYLLDTSPEYPNADKRPAVLVCPGGGYSMCSDREAEPVALAYAGAGFQAFVLRYSVSRTEDIFPRAEEDAQAALHYLRENAEELRILPDKVAAVGFSAGGHLAASLGTFSRERPNALVLGYPVILDKKGEWAERSFPGIDTSVDNDTPPAFVFATSDDRLVPVQNTLAFLQALADHGIHFESHIYLTGSHGLSLATPAVSGGNPGLYSETVGAWFADSVRFLRSVMGGVPVAGLGDGNRLHQQLVYGIDCPVQKLLERADTTAMLERAFPGTEKYIRENVMSWSVTLRQLQQMDPAGMPEEKLLQLQKELQKANEA